MTNLGELEDYAARSARALVLMHEGELRRFVFTWKKARDVGVVLPETEDPDYASLESLLRHVLDASRFYVTWVSEKLGLPDPDIRRLGPSPVLDATIDAQLEHLEQRWRAALQNATPADLESESWRAPWGAPFTADAMLEHAVLHPARHRFQLEELIEAT